MVKAAWWAAPPLLYNLKAAAEGGRIMEEVATLWCGRGRWCWWTCGARRDCALAEWWQFAAHVRDLASQLVCTLVRGMNLASTLTTLQPSPIRPAYVVGGLGVSH